MEFEWDNRIEFESIFSGTCVFEFKYCNYTLANELGRPMHLDKFHSRTNFSAECSIRVVRWLLYQSISILYTNVTSDMKFIIIANPKQVYDDWIFLWYKIK